MQTAIFCSKVFQIEMERDSQSAFTIFTGQKSHRGEMVIKAQAYIESKLDEKISVEHLSTMFSVGRRNFDRGLLKLPGIQLQLQNRKTYPELILMLLLDCPIVYTYLRMLLFCIHFFIFVCQMVFLLALSIKIYCAYCLTKIFGVG